MAQTQSKLVLPAVLRERTIKGVISQLTTLYLQNRTRISRAVYITLFVALINRVRHAIAEQKAASVREAAERAQRKGTTSSTDEPDSATTKKKKVELNREFFRSLLRLLRIVIPGWRSKETRLLISHSFFLVLRTLISLKVAAMDGAIVKALVKGNGREFLMRIVWWMLIAVPATFTNSMVCDQTTLWGCLPRKSGLLLTPMASLAVVSPSRALPEVSDTIDTIHPRQIPIPIDLLWNLRARRQDQEPGPADCCRRG